MIQDSRRSIWTARPSIWKCTAQVTCSNPLFCAVINRPLFGRLRSQIDVWRFRWQLWQPPLLQLSALWLLLVQLKHNCFWVNIFWRSLTVTTWGQLAQMWSFLLPYMQLCVCFLFPWHVLKDLWCQFPSFWSFFPFDLLPSTLTCKSQFMSLQHFIACSGWLKSHSLHPSSPWSKSALVPFSLSSTALTFPETSEFPASPNFEH